MHRRVQTQADIINISCTKPATTAEQHYITCCLQLRSISSSSKLRIFLVIVRRPAGQFKSTRRPNETEGIWYFSTGVVTQFPLSYTEPLSLSTLLFAVFRRTQTDRQIITPGQKVDQMWCSSVLRFPVSLFRVIMREISAQCMITGELTLSTSIVRNSSMILADQKPSTKSTGPGWSLDRNNSKFTLQIKRDNIQQRLNSKGISLWDWLLSRNNGVKTTFANNYDPVKVPG